MLLLEIMKKTGSKHKMAIVSGSVNNQEINIPEIWIINCAQSMWTWLRLLLLKFHWADRYAIMSMWDTNPSNSCSSIVTKIDSQKPSSTRKRIPSAMDVYSGGMDMPFTGLYCLLKIYYFLWKSIFLWEVWTNDGNRFSQHFQTRHPPRNLLVSASSMGKADIRLEIEQPN